METKFSEYKEKYQDLRDKQREINKEHYTIRCGITDDFANRSGKIIPKLQLRLGSHKHYTISEIYFNNNREAKIYLKAILEDYIEQMFDSEKIDIDDFKGTIRSRTQNLELSLGTLKDYEFYEAMTKEIFQVHNVTFENSVQKAKTKII